MSNGAWGVVVTDSGDYATGSLYGSIVEQDETDPRRFLSPGGMIRMSGRLKDGLEFRLPKNKKERERVQREQEATEAQRPKLTRWAKRDGKVVEWGNLVMGMRGQEFHETFATEAEAGERERQALAGEPIGKSREPIAVERRDLR